MRCSSTVDRDLLRRHADALPQHCREPPVLQALLGHSVAEITTILELPPVTIMTRLFRARHKRLTALAPMNGRQFREHCLVAPLARQARTTHRHQCWWHCAAFERRALTVEVALHDALEVPVTSAMPAGPSPRRRWLPFLAATATIGTLGPTLVVVLRPTPDLATLAARHMRHIRLICSAARLRRTAAAGPDRYLGGESHSSLPPPLHATACTISGRDGAL